MKSPPFPPSAIRRILHGAAGHDAAWPGGGDRRRIDSHRRAHGVAGSARQRRTRCRSDRVDRRDPRRPPGCDGRCGARGAGAGLPGIARTARRSADDCGRRAPRQRRDRADSRHAGALTIVLRNPAAPRSPSPRGPSPAASRQACSWWKTRWSPPRCIAASWPAPVIDVEIAHDGVEALEMLRGRQWDLVITDVDMPNMNGVELTAHLRADPRLRRLPVIIVSSRDSGDHRRTRFRCRRGRLPREG